MDFQSAISAAIANIANHGDTDVFPLPFENLAFFDKPTGVVDILKSIHEDLDAALATKPLTMIESLTQVGYSGFRRTHLIDPFWKSSLRSSIFLLVGTW
jgi:hypothetical protein